MADPDLFFLSGSYAKHHSGPQSSVKLHISLIVLVLQFRPQTQALSEEGWAPPLQASRWMDTVVTSTEGSACVLSVVPQP